MRAGRGARTQSPTLHLPGWALTQECFPSAEKEAPPTPYSPAPRGCGGGGCAGCARFPTCRAGRGERRGLLGGAEEARPPRDAWLGPATGAAPPALDGRPAAPSPQQRWRGRAVCACEMRSRAARTRATTPAVAAKAGAASSVLGARCMRASTRAQGSHRPRRSHKHLFRTRSPR